jgi:DNA-binding response OmpR family regulator
MGAALPKKAIDPRTALLRELTGGLIASLRAEVARVSAMPTAETQAALARRLAGLAGRAHRLEIPSLHEELRTCRDLVEDIEVDSVVEESLKRDLDQTLVRIVTFADAELARAQGRSAPKRRQRRRRKPRAGSLSLGMVVPETIIDSLLSEDWVAEDDAPGLQVQRIEASTTAHHELRELRPDVIIVDGDDAGARRLVEQLMHHNETDSIPVIVVGSWDRAEGAAPFIALGVARTLPKPVAPTQLRQACLDVGPNTNTLGFEPIGVTNLDGLGARLANEIHRGLCDAADDTVRRRQVDYGDGAEVLTVLWEAIGRMRELVTAESRGRVRFSEDPTLRAMPRATWIRGAGRRRDAERASAHQEVREPADAGASALAGLNVVVAEDDLSTNWFLCGVLREAGAEVHSVYDGRKALDHMYRELPDLILSDVVMPDLDGYTLCRAVKRDVLLRSVPVVLLSWKADLLQRMRELGAQADGYMLKEASGEEILQRVIEVLRPRSAVADRIGEDDSVRGRLDGLTPHALLKLVARVRPDARVSIRDAHHLYEVELRGGRPVIATQTAPDGTTLRGRPVISSLVGVGDGRFGVAAVDPGSASTAELDGTLEEQLLEPIARARAAQGLLSGPSIMRVDRVQLDETRIGTQLSATPEPSRGLLRAIMAGASPRDLVAGGRASAELVERVLCDAARYGAVRAVLTPRGLDMLPAAVDREMAVLSGEADDETVRMSHAMLTGAITDVLEGVEDTPPPLSAPEEDPSISAPVELAPEDELDWGDDEFYRDHELHAGTDEEPGFSDEEAVEGHDGSGDVDLAEMVAGSADEGDDDFDQEEDDDGLAGPLGRASQPLIAQREQTPVLASAVEVAEHARHHTPIGSRVDGTPRFAALDSIAPAEVDVEAPRDEPSSKQASKADSEADGPKAGVSEPDGFKKEGDQLQPIDGPRVPRLPMPSAWATKGDSAPKKKSRSWLLPMAFGAIGVSLAVGARWYREQQPYSATPPPAQLQAPLPPVPTAAAPPVQAPTQTDQAPEDEAGQEQGAPEPDPAIELPLTKEEIAKLKDGQGVLEVVAGRKNQVFVEGRKVGRGPVVTLPLEARDEPYEVRVKMEGEERVRYVVVKKGVRRRVRVAPPWSR